jgi:hypothetical protein
VQHHPVSLGDARLNIGLMDFVEKKRKAAEGDLIFPGKVVRNSANLDTFIASLKRADSLGLDFSVTRELEWADRGQNLKKIEGGDPRSAFKMVRQRVAPL